MFYCEVLHQGQSCSWSPPVSCCHNQRLHRTPYLRVTWRYEHNNWCLSAIRRGRGIRVSTGCAWWVCEVISAFLLRWQVQWWVAPALEGRVRRIFLLCRWSNSLRFKTKMVYCVALRTKLDDWMLHVPMCCPPVDLWSSFSSKKHTFLGYLSIITRLHHRDTSSPVELLLSRFQHWACLLSAGIRCRWLFLATRC